MDAIDATPAPPDINIRELEQRWQISRNALRARATALGVELRRVSSTLTVWPGEAVELGDQLHQHLQQGGTLASFGGGSAITTSSGAAVTASRGSRAGQGGLPDGFALELLAAVLQGQQAADPLAMARGLAEAADQRLPLTRKALAGLVGHGIDGFKDGCEKYGFRFRKHESGSGVVWTVERAL